MGRAASSGKMGVNTMAAGCSANNLVKATTKTNKVQKEKESGRTVNVSNGRTDEAGEGYYKNQQGSKRKGIWQDGKRIEWA